MARLLTLKNRIQYRIKKSKENTFLVKDFLDLSGRDQVLRALRSLMKDNLVMRVGKGIYTKARKSTVSGRIIPQENLRNVAICAMNKLGVKIVTTPAEQAYNAKLTTQIPNGFIIGVDRRVSRNISFGKAAIRYETVN